MHKEKRILHIPSEVFKMTTMKDSGHQPIKILLRQFYTFDQLCILPILKVHIIQDKLLYSYHKFYESEVRQIIFPRTLQYVFLNTSQKDKCISKYFTVR